MISINDISIPPFKEEGSLVQIIMQYQRLLPEIENDVDNLQKILMADFFNSTKWLFVSRYVHFDIVLPIVTS